MATANRVAALKAAHESNDRKLAISEQRRHNKASEEIDRKKMLHGAIGSYVKSGVDAVGHVAKLVNDPKWYMKVPGTEVAGNVNAVKIGGIPYAMDGFDRTNNTRATVTFIPPQIVTASYHPAIGTTTAPFANAGTHPSGRYLVNPVATSDFQKAAQEFFAFLRKKNGGSLNGLDPTDVLEALICFAELAGLREHLARLYRLINTWEKGERTVPNTLIAAIYGIPTGYTATTVVNYWAEHRIQLLALINTLTKRLNTLPIPKSFAYASRRIYLNSRIFVETSGSLYKKYYAYRPQGVLFWLDVPETVTTSGGDLDVVVLGEKEMANGVRSIADVQSLISDVGGRLFDSTDISLVCSYIMNSYDVSERSDKIMYFEEIKESEAQEFDFDESFGLQFRNIKCYGDTAGGNIATSNYSTQFAVIERLTNGTIWQNKRYAANYSINYADQLHLLDVIHAKELGKISQEECFEATRGISSLMSVTDDGSTYSYIAQCGTEVFTKIDVVSLNTSGALNYNTLTFVVNTNKYFADAQQFRYLPCYVSTSSVADNLPNWSGGNAALHTWAVLDSNQIDLLHKVAVYSEFLLDEVVF